MFIHGQEPYNSLFIQGQEAYNAKDKEVKKSITNDKRSFVEGLAAEAECASGVLSPDVEAAS